MHNRCWFLYRTTNFHDLNKIFEKKLKMPKRRKRDAVLNMRRKNFKPNESQIKNCEDGIQIKLKEANVEENDIQNPTLEEKTIKKKITCKKR